MDNSRRTPLHLAATNGSSAILSLFISHSASLHLADSDGTTALQLAVAEGHMEFAEMFLS
jgi:ankyrin repeat protein